MTDAALFFIASGVWTRCYQHGKGYASTTIIPIMLFILGVFQCLNSL